MAPVTGAVGRMNILTLNEGSSSLKFGLYAASHDQVEEVTAGEIDGAAADPFVRIEAMLDGVRPDVIGHRVVHGGPVLSEPVRIDASVIAALDHAATFAPLHGPAALALIKAAERRYPGVPQVACFDTAFHTALPDLAATLPVPKALRAAGVRRYGFHGLSCQSVVRQLGNDRPHRLVVAHLGSGASVTAIRNGRSIDTSMGLTPSGGVVMATRAGDLDPGLPLFLLREQGMQAADLERLVDRESGLLGVSGLSGDMRKLHDAAPADPDADLAIRLFCRSVAKQIAAMMTSLGGADLIVFTGGIGEHDPRVRGAICRDLAWAGVDPDATGGGGRVAVRTLPAREDLEIAWGVASLLARENRGG